MSKTQQAAIDDMVAGLATEQSPDWSLRQRLALGCRILGMQGHGSGLSGQFTARGPEPETMWTLPYGLGFEQVKASDYMLVDRDLKVIEGKGMPNMANRFHIHVETEAILVLQEGGESVFVPVFINDVGCDNQVVDVGGQF